MTYSNSTKQIVLSETKAEMPKHAIFVNEEGFFNIVEAEKYLIGKNGADAESIYRTEGNYYKAQRMNIEGLDAYYQKSKEVTARTK